MKQVSSRYLRALNLSHDTITTITCTPPGEAPVSLSPMACTVAMQSGTGRRRTASVAVSPQPGLDLYGLVSTPGAIFQIHHGIKFGPRLYERVPVFYGEAASGGVSLAGGDISLSLTDQWARVERCRLLAPYSPPNGASRAQRITDLILGAIPGATVHQLADGGIMTGELGTWDRDRTQPIKDLATDGSLEVWPDVDGSWVIRPVPTSDPKASVYTFKTGDAGGNILSADRERPLDRLYNTVVVVPGEKQTWARQIATVPADSPRHPDKIGTVPYFYASPTIKTSGQAMSAATTILARVIGSTERLTMTGLINPALEPGDMVTALHPATEVDPGFRVAHLFDSGRADYIANTMTLDTLASVPVEEAA